MIYHMAIIDYLQDYTCIKKCEHFIMPILKQVDASTVSVQEPRVYGHRFSAFLEKILFD